MDPIAILSLKGKVFYVNQGWEELTGRDKSEVLGKSVFAVTKMLTGGIPKILSQLKTILKNGGIKNTELKILTKEKKAVHVLVSATLYKDIDGENRNIIVVTRDITELKTSREAFGEKEEHYSKLLALTDDVMVTLDGKGYIQSISGGIENVPGAGHAVEELIGKHYTYIVVKRDLPRLLKVLIKAWRNPGCFDNHPMTGYLKAKDGTLIITEGKAITHILDGEITGVSIMLRDIREREKAKKALNYESKTPAMEFPKKIFPIYLNDSIAQTLQK